MFDYHWKLRYLSMYFKRITIIKEFFFLKNQFSSFKTTSIILLIYNWKVRNNGNSLNCCWRPADRSSLWQRLILSFVHDGWLTTSISKKCPLSLSFFEPKTGHILFKMWPVFCSKFSHQHQSFESITYTASIFVGTNYTIYVCL